VNRSLVVLGALFGFLGVALGAFAAHSLKATIDAESLAVFQTGVHYQTIHALAILVVAIMIQLNPGRPRLVLSGYLFAAGTVLFSGSLYALSLSGVKWLGAITPLGGSCLLAGWLTLLVVGASRPADLPS
jgi:uncharacterized membrane protein YgdD (TMEM256/DUF423 family)